VIDELACHARFSLSKLAEVARYVGDAGANGNCLGGEMKPFVLTH
jgi:hypothetical protein